MLGYAEKTAIARMQRRYEKLEKRILSENQPLTELYRLWARDYSSQFSLGHKKQNVGLFLGGQERFFIETKEKTS